VDVLALVAEGTNLEEGRFANGCSVSEFRPQVVSPGDNFNVPLQAPLTLRLAVYDNCNNKVTDRKIDVSAAFGNGDPVLTLNYERDNEWTGTWIPRNGAAGPVNITMTALQIGRSGVAGRGVRSGRLLPAGTVLPPLVTRGAIENAATLQVGSLVAPGSLVTIRGKGFADGERRAAGLPLGYELDGTEVLLQGRQLALLYTSDGQINAQIPYDVTANAEQQLLVRRGATLMLDPEVVTVAPAQPGVLTTNQQGTGQAFAYVQNADGTRILADGRAPAAAGSTVVILAAGLGETDRNVAAGQRPPDSPRASVANPVEVSIGGVAAQVRSATLDAAADLPGRYEVVVTMPQGVSAGDAAIVISVAGQTSPATATIAAR
jgi:uncharacterized protein (TIGR03437 family)